MFEQSWEIAIVLGTVLLYVLLLVQFVRSRRTHADRTEIPEPEPIDESGIEGPTVLCQECGTANEQGYRFCRSCISELPQPGGFERDGGNPLIRETR
ncbi:MAG: DUF7577 domain-containing protein [Halodesulfurarchaeum sp.]